MEDIRQEDILNIALGRLEQDGLWFTTKDDKIYANAKNLYKLDKFGELEDKSKERLIKEVTDYLGDGAGFVIEAVNQWIEDNVMEGILGYVDTLAMNFEPKEVVEETNAYDELGYTDLETTVAEESKKGKKTESKLIEDASDYSKPVRIAGKWFRYNYKYSEVEYITHISNEHGPIEVIDSVGMSKENWDNKQERNSYIEGWAEELDAEAERLASDILGENKKIIESNHGDFEAYQKYIMDNLYLDSETLTIDEEILRDNVNLVAEDAAKEVVAEILGEQEYTGLYSQMVDVYEKEIKSIILANIDTIVYLQNSEQQRVNNLTEGLYHVLGVKKDKQGNYSEEWIIAFDTEEQCERFRQEQEDYYKKQGYESLSIASDAEYNDNGNSYEIDYSDGSAWEDGDFFEVSNDEESFKITKRGNKWVDNEGNKFMGYLSPRDIMHYFKGYRIVESKPTKLQEVNYNNNPTVNQFNKSYKKEEKKTLTEGVRQRLNERNEQSAGIIEQALNGITDQTSEQEAGIITKTSELFQSLSDRGYDVQVSFDNGESTSSISIGQQGANVLITITDAEQPLRAFASGNFEINDDSLKMIKSIMEVLK